MSITETVSAITPKLPCERICAPRMRSVFASATNLTTLRSLVGDGAPVRTEWEFAEAQVHSTFLRQILREPAAASSGLV